MVSGRNSSRVPPPNIEDFYIWRRAFQRGLRERSSLQNCFSELIKAGCDKDDLEEALWWLVLNVHFSQSTVRTEIRDYLALLETLLPQLEELRPNLEMLLNTRPQNKLEFFDRFSLQREFPKQRRLILRIPKLIDDLYDVLKEIHDRFKVHRSTLAALPASVAEVLLFEYVKRATHGTAEVDNIMDQIHRFQKLAFVAYGMEGLHRRVYEGASWARRYRRFKSEHENIQEAIVCIVEEFIAEKARGKDIRLLRFFIDSYSAWERSLRGPL
ncbi:MAG: hypothetical protein WAU58_18485 [Terriglobales bacterium]